MEPLIQKIRTTLTEELSLLQNMLDLAEETRLAIVSRSAQQLFHIETRQQTVMMKLQIVRQIQENLLVNVRANLAPGEQIQGRGIKGVIRTFGQEEEWLLMDRVESYIKELAMKNVINERLLTKQYNSLTSYQHILDVVQGVDKVYDRIGGVQRVEQQNFVEQRG